MESSRVPLLTRAPGRVSAAEIVLLLACGAVAAMAVGLVKLGLGIPGHAIVLASLPMAFGIAVAPRRLAGSVMSAGALGTALLLTVTRAATYGSGAVVSLSLLGPVMDIALRRARGGRWITDGSSSLLYGDNALAAVIEITTIDDEPDATFELTAGTTHQRGPEDACPGPPGAGPSPQPRPHTRARAFACPDRSRRRASRAAAAARTATAIAETFARTRHSRRAPGFRSARSGALQRAATACHPPRSPIRTTSSHLPYALLDLGLTQVLCRRYELAFDITNVFDQLYEQSYGSPREGRAAVLTLRARLN